NLLGCQPCEGLRHFACALDEKLRSWSDRAIFQGHDSKGPCWHRQIDRQYLEWRKVLAEAQHRPWNHDKKRPACKEGGLQVDRSSGNTPTLRVDAASARCFGDH